MNTRSTPSRRLYLQIADQLRTLIYEPDFAVNGRLPSERTLAEQLGVSRPSIREALVALHEHGHLRAFRARGEEVRIRRAFMQQTAQPDGNIRRAACTVRCAERLGKAARLNDAPARYIAYCRSTVAPDFSLRGLRLVLDCAHGATYQVAPALFTALGAEVLALGAEPDGFNINRDVGSTHPAALQRAVIAQAADLGIAFDGDGDRVQLVDGQGRLVDGDDILFVLASAWQAQGRLRGPVVGTLMTNFGLEQRFAAAGIGFVRARVGDRYVLQQLKQHGGTLGGETSGHILCLDRATTGDAMVCALQVLEAMRSAGQDLAHLCRGWTRLPQTTVNVRAAGAARALESAAVQAVRAEVERELAGRGRLVLRPSGTEPLVRVTVEAADATLVDALVRRLAQAVESAAA